MNICMLSGRILRDALVTGEGRVIKFLLVTKYRYKTDRVNEGTTTVPCVLFDPSKEAEEALLEKGKSSIYCECQGRVSRSSYEGHDGQRKYATEVIIDPDTLVIRKQ